MAAQTGKDKQADRITELEQGKDDVRLAPESGEKSMQPEMKKPQPAPGGSKKESGSGTNKDHGR